jgi:hypothetical protein
MAACNLDHGAALLSSTPAQTTGAQILWILAAGWNSKAEIKTSNDDDTQSSATL